VLAVFIAASKYHVTIKLPPLKLRFLKKRAACAALGGNLQYED
jgi:hypothetical protein